MPSIVSTGIGSGIDIAGIVQQLIAAEATPVQTRIGQQEAKAQSQLSAFGSLKSALADFRDKLETMKSLDSFLARAASSGNEDVFTATSSQTAIPASYSVEVLQLAQAQKLTSGVFADSDTAVGTGTLTIAVGASSFDVEVTTENNTLAGIRDAINNATDNTGIAATIVNADAGSYLILSGEKTGVGQSAVITQIGGDGGLSALEYDPVNGLNSLSEITPAQDATLRIDGFDIVSDSNTIIGAVSGVTLNLQQADPGNTAELVIENDEAVVRKTIEGFVASYNELVDTFDRLSKYDPETKTGSALLGDASVRSMREQIRREFSGTVGDLDAPFSNLAEVGVEIQLDGKLKVDDADLSAVVASDFLKFGQLFTTTDGYAVRLFDLVDGFLDADGIVETRTTGLNKRFEEFSAQRESLNQRLTSLESRLLRQFNALDSLISQLTSTSNFLQLQLSNLPGVTRPGNN